MRCDSAMQKNVMCSGLAQAADPGLAQITCEGLAQSENPGLALAKERGRPLLQGTRRYSGQIPKR